MNVIARLEYELAYYDSAVHRFNHYTTRTPPMTTSVTNEYTSLQKYKSLTLYFRKGDVCSVWEMNWRQGQTAILTQVLLTIAALLSHLSWVAQPWVTKGPKPSVCELVLHAGILSPTDSNRLSTWLYYYLRPPASAVLPLIYTGASLDWRYWKIYLIQLKIFMLIINQLTFFVWSFMRKVNT